MRKIILWMVCLLVMISWTDLHSQTRNDRFAVGAQYSYYRNQHGFFLNDTLLGGRFDAQVVRHLWLNAQLDTGLSYHPHPRVSSIDGGRILLGRFGAKIGIQRPRIGVFAEARAGFVTWSDTLLFFDIRPSSPSVRFGRFTRPLLNVGIALEVYASRRFGLRFTGGDSMVFHGDRQVLSLGAPFPGFIAHNADVSSGLFFQF